MKKEDFPVFQEHRELIYLDNSATTQKPRQVIQSMVDFYEKSNANIHRGIHLLSQKATLEYEQARQVVANFIGADAEEIIFTSGTTQSLNMAARILSSSLQSGDEIILTDMEHHSNLVPWQQVAKERQCVLKFISLTPDYRLDLEKAQNLVTEKTKIIAVTHISNVLGTINPIEELAHLAHKAGALFIVDAAQSAPHLKINVKEIDCDFLAFSGHKMCGPTGIGVLYGKKRLLQQYEPVEFGGGMIREVAKETATWADLPEKFEAGTPNIAGAIGLMKAVEYLENIGMERIERYGQELTAYALKRLSSVHGIMIIGPSTLAHRAPVVSFTIQSLHPHDVSDFLDKHSIAVRAGHHCAMPLMETLGINGTVRASFYFYNTLEDIDVLVEALQQLGTPFSEGVAIDKEQIIFGDLTEEQELYKENVIDHYKEPRNKRMLDVYTHSHTEFNPLCGDNLTIYLHVEGNKIQNVSFKGNGCVISQASVSLLTEEMKGKSLDTIGQFTEKKIFSLLGIPISPTRYRCALLSLKALRGALQHGLRN